MSQYTTGEVAKLCGVSVRTVQYYDSRGILTPSALSEGGRRLYNDDDLRRLRIICFLREMGFSIDNIGMLFAEPGPGKVITMLVEQRERETAQELAALQTRLDQLGAVKWALRSFESLCVDSLGDIAHMVKNHRKRRRMLLWMVVVGLVMDVIEVGAVVCGIRTGIWWPMAVGLPIVLGLGVFISRCYFRHVACICPECHHVFRPRLREALWAAHTPNTRRVTCDACGHRGFCVEIYQDKEKIEC